VEKGVSHGFSHINIIFHDVTIASIFSWDEGFDLVQVGLVGGGF
jgi:hypothetical protein